MAKKTGLTGVDVLFGPRSGPGTVPPLEVKEERVRTSVYLDPEDVVLLDQLQSLEFQREKRRPDRSELLRKALRFYHRSLVDAKAP